jgi:acetyltransferase
MNIPTFPYPDTAVRAFNYMWRYAYNLKGIYETPMLPSESGADAPDRARVEQIITKARQEGRTILSEYESKQIFAAYGISTTKMHLATTPDEAVKCAEELGYPVVLKLHSHTITHKVDVGGVKLNLGDGDAVRRAFEEIRASVTEKAGAEHFLGVSIQPMVKLDGYEIIIGSSLDAQFGPVILFGSGGSLVEVYKDRALALPPLNTTLARRMMQQTLIYKALQGVRGRKGVDMNALELLLVRFSQMVVEQRWIKEIDINPLLASPERLLALDARVLLYEPEVTEDQLPKTAIRPYPRQYIDQWTLRDGTAVTVRPIRPEDEPLLVRFHATLSDQTVYLRYFSALKLEQRVAHERLARISFIDYDREMALVMEYTNPKTHENEIIAVGRLSKLHGREEGEFAVLVSDAFQRQGIGKEMLKRIIQIGRDEELKRIVGHILPDNTGMINVAESWGFKIQRPLSGTTLRAVMDL